MPRALLLWIAAVLVISLLPLKLKLMLGTTGPLHAWGHYLVFLITTIIAAWKTKGSTTPIWIGGLVVLFGLLVEGSEVLLYHNAFEWRDVLIDSLGVVTGLFLLWLPSSRFVMR